MEQKKKALGRGLEELFSTEVLDFNTFESNIMETATADEIKEIPVSEIRPNPYQPRKTFNEDALRELSEDTGLTANNIFSIGDLYTTPALIDEVIHMYIATDLVEGEQHLDEDEFVNTLKMPLSQAVEMVMNGEIKDSKTQTIILKADKYFQKQKEANK